MKITVYTIIHNEEKMLPFFLEHYSEFCDNIIVYDNESTDKSVEIAQSCPKVKSIISIPSSNKLDDSMYIRIKNNCWINDTSDYVIIVDADELLYHENVVEYLHNTKKELYIPTGYNMISESFPEHGQSITEQVKTGVEDHMYNKPVIFNPNIVKNAQYSMGAHTGCFFAKNGSIVQPFYSQFKLLHYKNMGFEYRFNRHKYFHTRMSDFNKSIGAGIHYTWDEETQKEEFDNLLHRCKNII